MIGIFVFQRYGLVVPIALLAMGLVVEYIVDNKFGDGYYGSSNHIWTFGVWLILSGIIVSLIAYYVDDDGRNRDGSSDGSGLPSYDSLLEETDGNGEGNNSNNISKLNCFNPTTSMTMSTTMKENMRDFIMEPSTKDQFCYVPMNYCGLALIGCGVFVTLIGMFV